MRSIVASIFPGLLNPVLCHCRWCARLRTPQLIETTGGHGAITEDAESSGGHCRNSGNDRRRIVLDPDLRIVRGPQVSRLSPLSRSKSHLSHLGVSMAHHPIASLNHVCPSAAFAFFAVGFLDSSARTSRSRRAAAAGRAQHIGYPRLLKVSSYPCTEAIPPQHVPFKAGVSGVAGGGNPANESEN